MTEEIDSQAEEYAISRLGGAPGKMGRRHDLSKAFKAGYEAAKALNPSEDLTIAYLKGVHDERDRAVKEVPGVFGKIRRLKELCKDQYNHYLNEENIRPHNSYGQGHAAGQAAIYQVMVRHLGDILLPPKDELTEPPIVEGGK